MRVLVTKNVVIFTETFVELSDIVLSLRASIQGGIHSRRAIPKIATYLHRTFDFFAIFRPSSQPSSSILRASLLMPPSQAPFELDKFLTA